MDSSVLENQKCPNFHYVYTLWEDLWERRIRILGHILMPDGQQ